jgi:hypothetical protein
MNSFDEVQCEETPNAQLCFNMEEMAIYQEWMEEREREAQKELDEVSDRELEKFTASTICGV